MKDVVIIRVSGTNNNAIYCNLYKKGKLCFSNKEYRFGKLIFMDDSIDWETWKMGAVPLENLYCVDFYKGEDGGAYFSFTSANEKYVAMNKKTATTDETPFTIHESMLGFIPSKDDVVQIQSYMLNIGVPVNMHPYFPHKFTWHFYNPLDFIIRFILFVIRY